MGTHCRERDVFPSVTSPIISFRSPILWHLKLTFKLRNKNCSQDEIDSHPRQVSCIEILEFALFFFFITWPCPSNPTPSFHVLPF